MVLDAATLGTYKDLNSIISTHPETEPSPFAWLIIAAKLLILAVTAFALWRLIGRKLALKDSVVLFLAAATTIAALVATQPWENAEAVGARISGFAESLTMDPMDPVEYTPSLLSPAIEFVSAPVSVINDALDLGFMPETAKLPTIQGGDFPTVAFSEVDLGWLRTLIYIALILLAFYAASKLNLLAGLLAACVLSLLAIDVSNQKIACVIIAALSAACACFLHRRGLTFLAAYPAAVILLCSAFLLQPPKAFLVLILTASFMLSLFPLFYLLGLILRAGGELFEAREKLGMKRRPVKVVEAEAGEWDPVAVALIGTLWFTAVIILFGSGLQGLTTFLAGLIAMMKR